MCPCDNLKSPFIDSFVDEFYTKFDPQLPMEKQATIREATFEDLSFLSEFQISMAKETENLDLTSSIINEAIDYLLHHSEMGLILLATIDNTPVASILGTIESPDRAWIQSVFVHQQHRRKGIFRKMFLEMCQCQRARGFKSIFLYAEKENERALAAYFKLGMSLAEGLRMYGFDFVYSGDQLPTVQKKYQIVPAEETPAQKIDSFRDLLGGERLGNSGLEIHEGEELVGYAEYFQ